jgi:hypothetical protein
LMLKRDRRLQNQRKRGKWRRPVFSAEQMPRQRRGCYFIIACQ